jgi:hypothetical protein
MDKQQHLLLPAQPDTILHWHRNLLKRRHASTCAPTTRSATHHPLDPRPRATPAREYASWGYRRIHGELAALGIKVAAFTVQEILRDHDIPPAPERQDTTWADFLRTRPRPCSPATSPPVPWTSTEGSERTARTGDNVVFAPTAHAGPTIGALRGEPHGSSSARRPEPSANRNPLRLDTEFPARHRVSERNPLQRRAWFTSRRR